MDNAQIDIDYTYVYIEGPKSEHIRNVLIVIQGYYEQEAQAIADYGCENYQYFLEQQFRGEWIYG